MSGITESLASQINEAHRLTQEHLGKTILFAIEAGRLLIEAKAATPHGRWLPWLRENITFSERTAQAYMTVHRRWGRNPQRVADLPLRKALAEAAHPARMEAREDREAEPPAAPSKIFDELADKDFEQVIDWFSKASNAPFNALDLDIDQIHPSWIQSKLFDKLGLPVVVSFFLQIIDGYPPLPLLRLLDIDDIDTAGTALVPIASGESLPAIDTTEMSIKQLTEITVTMQMTAARAARMLLMECEHRETITDEQFADEWTDTHTCFLSTVDARIDAVQENRAKNERGEFKTREEGIADLDRAMTLPVSEAGA